MEELNTFEIEYNKTSYLVKTVGKKEIDDILYTILNVSIINDKTIPLGNFYTKMDNLITDEAMYDFIKYLIDNIDEIIFKKNRFIIDNYNNTTRSNDELSKIYSEFLKLPKNSNEYLKYSYFLQLYFTTHQITDGIKKIFLDKANKSILDYDDIDEQIKSQFKTNINLLNNDTKKNNKKIDILNNKLKNIEDEINILNEIITIIKNTINTLKTNNDVNLSIKNIKKDLKNTPIFSKNRKKLKKDLKELKKNIVIVDIPNIRKKIYDMYYDYTTLYNDKHGLLLIFDNLTLEDILSIIESIYNNQNKHYNKLVTKIDDYNDDYNDISKNIDISDLYERIESK